jgi:hypothetical protein
MPYLKLTCPLIDVAKRENIARVLTDEVVRLNLSPYVPNDPLREHCTIHFTPYEPDGMAIGGVLMRDRPIADVTVEYSDWSLSRRKQRRIARALTKVLADLFEMQGEQDAINIRFHPYPPTDFAVGGMLLAERIPLIGRLMKRLRR